MVGRQYVSNISSVVDIFYLDTRAVKSKNIKLHACWVLKKRGTGQKPPYKSHPEKSPLTNNKVPSVQNPYF